MMLRSCPRHRFSKGAPARSHLPCCQLRTWTLWKTTMIGSPGHVPEHRASRVQWGWTFSPALQAGDGLSSSGLKPLFWSTQPMTAGPHQTFPSPHSAPRKQSPASDVPAEAQVPDAPPMSAAEALVQDGPPESPAPSASMAIKGLCHGRKHCNGLIVFRGFFRKL